MSSGNLSDDPALLYGSAIPIVVQHHDEKSQAQPLLDHTHTAPGQYNQPSSTTSISGSGYGPKSFYHIDFIHAEDTLPPLTFYTPLDHRTEIYSSEYADSDAQRQPQQHNQIQALLPQQQLLRNITLLGGHLHGKTCIIDILLSQTHPAINLITQTTAHTAKHGGNQPRSKKPTVRNDGKQSTTLQKESGQDCWPIQYADAMHRERVVGYTTAAKTITIPATTFLTKYPTISAQRTTYTERTWLLNLHDTPGHSQYVDQAFPLLQRGAQSGCCLVVDCVEGLTMELQLQMEYCIKLSLPMVLILNKLDRLVLELCLPPNDAYFKLVNVLEQINAHALTIYTLYHGNNNNNNNVNNNSPYPCPSFSPVDNNVVFMSTLHCWAFTLQSFSELYFYTRQQQQQQQQPDQSSTKTPSYCDRDIRLFSSLLWGNIFFDNNRNAFVKQRQTEHQSRTFVEFILNPLYTLYSTCLTGDTKLIEHVLVEQLSVSPHHLNHHALRCGHDQLFRDAIGKWLYLPFYAHCGTTSMSSGPSIYTNAFFTAHVLTTLFTQALPPPVLRKHIYQHNTLLYRPQLQLIAPPVNKNHHNGHGSAPQVQQSPFDKLLAHFPATRASLAELLQVVPHPNGQSFGYLCRVHTLSINNERNTTPPQCQDDPINALPAFSVGDMLTLYTTSNQTHQPPQRIAAIYSPCSMRYRIPLDVCYDNNIVIFSFEDDNNNNNNNTPPMTTPPSYLYQQPTSTINHSQHGTFINHKLTLLKKSSAMSNADSDHSAFQQILLTESLADLKTYIPTFLRPEVIPGNNIFQLSIEPTIPDELPALLSALRRAHLVYGAALVVAKQHTGCYTIQTRGETIADDIIQYLRTVNNNLYISHQNTINLYKLTPSYNHAQLSFSISTPFYHFREGASQQSTIPATATSLNNYNSITCSAEEAELHTHLLDNTMISQREQQQKKQPQDNAKINTLPDQLLHAHQYNQYSTWFSLNDLTVTDLTSTLEANPVGVNQVNRTYHLFEKYGWDDISISATPWSYGLLQDANVTLYDDCTRHSRRAPMAGAHSQFSDYENTDFHQPGQWPFDSIAPVINGFNGVVLEGPLTESPLHNTTIKFQNLSINKNPLYSNDRFLIPTVRRSVLGAVLLSSPVIYEPLVTGEIITKDQYRQMIEEALSNRRGAVVEKTPISSTPYHRFVYKVPAMESMGLTVDLKMHTQGQAKISTYHHSFQVLEGDPLDADIPVPILKIAPLQHLARELMVKTRKKRGLPQFSLEQYFDQTFLDALQSSE